MQSAGGESTAFAGVMPKAIHAATKQLSGKPLQMGQIPERFQIPKSQALRGRINEISNLPKNERTSIYAGMKKTQGGYMTFRRVSLNSDPDAFIHPGFKEANLAQKALDSIDIGSLMENVIDDFLVSV